MAKNYRIPILVTRKQKREYVKLVQARNKNSLGELIRDLLDEEVRQENACTKGTGR